MRAAICLAMLLTASAARANPALLGYYFEPQSYPSLQAEAGTLNGVAVDQFSIAATGKITGALPRNVKTIATAHGMTIFDTVSNYATNGFSATIAKAILPPGTPRNTAIAAIAALAKRTGANINIDFENVPHKLRADYTQFVQLLAARLHAQGELLMLSIPAVTQDDPNDSWAGAYDQPALGPLADTLQVMAYDENGPWGPPGPVAGLDWVTACLTFSESVNPPAKISLGMPAYGYDWNTTKGTGGTINWNQIPTLLAKTGATPQWDQTSSSPWFQYQDASGNAHVVWYENAQSIGLKASLAASTNTAGISVWALGLEDPTYWQAVLAGFSQS